MKLYNLLILLCIFSLVLFSCDDDNGDESPDGDLEGFESFDNSYDSDKSIPQIDGDATENIENSDTYDTSEASDKVENADSSDLDNEQNNAENDLDKDQESHENDNDSTSETSDNLETSEITENEEFSEEKEADSETSEATSCNFYYPFVYDKKRSYPKVDNVKSRFYKDENLIGAIVHPEPDPPAYHITQTADNSRDSRDLVMPTYTDNMPLFDRAKDWGTGTRCFELPGEAVDLTEAEAYDLYRNIVEKTTGTILNETPGKRFVMSLRGSHPGQIRYNDNQPDRFNDTIVLFWRDNNNKKRVKEFHASTESGPQDYGDNNSSHLKPNRVYEYRNNWHKDYNALKIKSTGYQVRDETNNNGHWDSDRNGWLPPLGEQDHYRVGSAHNIHLAAVNAPLWTSPTYYWTAGCQTIPGMNNWTEFITNAWTNLNDPIDYYLIDVRDIDPRAFNPCTENGSRECPFVIDILPYSDSKNLNNATSDYFDTYNCDTSTNESGPEFYYVLDITNDGTLHLKLDDISGDLVDADIHLLEGNSNLACLNRNNIELTADVYPGRYWIVVDTYVNSSNQELKGPFKLDVDFY